jgi:hypothetical protein
MSLPSKCFIPPDDKILSMYYQMFAKNGQLEFEEETLGLEPVEDEQAQECDEEETEE